MEKQIHLLLGASDVGQLLDGLDIREKAWRNTALFLETGQSPEAFLVAEECGYPTEAVKIVDACSRIMGTVRRQLHAQRTISKSQSDEPIAPPKEGTVSGFAIYVNTFCSGLVAVERNELDMPVVYPTERAAQLEIADIMIIRLRQFLAGERDFKDAIKVEDRILPVDLHSDGSITDEAGNRFPNDWW